MLPLLPFLAGVVVGASALGVYRRAKADPRVGKAVENASHTLRKAAVSGLESIQQSSAQWRGRIAGESVAADATDEKKAETTAANPRRRQARTADGKTKKESQ
ncbi:MAG: hypothetical protein LBO79_06095 [Zoogloeaceae bacterium]|jgi:hypothetical protein|nr:hypothetical protein [Zoogloeaceae bacterium]